MVCSVKLLCGPAGTGPKYSASFSISYGASPRALEEFNLTNAKGKLPFSGHAQVLAHLFHTIMALRSGLKAAANTLHSFVRVLMTNEIHPIVDVALM